MRLLRLALVAILGFTLSVSAQAAPLPKAGPDKSAEKVENIKKALEKTGNFEFTGVNLNNVINTLSEDYKVNTTLDQTAGNLVGISFGDMNVEFKQKDIKFRTALRGMLGQYGLSFGIIDGSIVISTEDMIVYRQLKQRVDINVDNTPLNKVLKDLSQRYAINIVLDPKLKAKVEGNVTLQVDDVQLDSAIKVLCEMAEVKSARIGNMLYITTEARADKLNEPLNPGSTPGGPIGPGMPFPFPVPGIGIPGGGAVPPPAIDGPAVPPMVVPER